MKASKSADMAGACIEVGGRGELERKLQFLGETAFELGNIADGLEEVIGRLVGPEPSCEEESKNGMEPDGILDKLDRSRDTYSAIVSRLGAALERLQRVI